MLVRPDQLKRCKQDSAKSVQFDFQEIDVTGTSLLSLIQMGGSMLLKHAIAGVASRGWWEFELKENGNSPKWVLSTQPFILTGEIPDVSQTRSA